jgi:hypothetical protein
MAGGLSEMSLASMNKAAALSTPAGAAGMAYDSSAQYESARDMAESGEPQELSPAATNAGQTRKLVKRAELRLRVDNPETTEKSLFALMEKYGAWSASTGIYENSRNYSIRVSSDSYDSLLAELAGMGKLIGRTENAEDVTLRYYDLEGRLATRQELLKTYQGYLGKAANIEEIMTVEGKISDLQYEIDRTGTQFRNLADLVDFSTIDVEILGPVSVSSYSAPTIGEKLGELFGSFGEIISSALVVLVGVVIYGVPAALVVILFYSVFFGRIGLLKKVWRFAAGKKVRPPKENERNGGNRE